MGAYSRVLSRERQDQVWILMRPLWLWNKEGISGAVISPGQSVQERLLEASRLEGLGACAKAAAMRWRAVGGVERW